MTHAKALLDLFLVRDDAYAVGRPDEKKPWKYRYFKKDEPPTEDVVARHIAGDQVIGMYCERLTDNHCKWFCFDFDAPKDEDDHPVEGGVEIALSDALAIQSALENAGLFTYLERSRSGNGIHLWGFLDDWVPADTLVDALEVALPATKPSTFDHGKRYPPLKRSPNSILVCLPYAGEAVEFGNGMFLDVGLKTEIPLAAFLAEVVVNKASVIARIAGEPAPKSTTSTTRTASASSNARVTSWEGRPERPISGLLKLLSPYGCGFMRGVVKHQHNGSVVGEQEWYAFLGQLSAFKNGRAAAHVIFGEHKYYDRRGMDAKYDHSCESPPVGCAFIHERILKDGAKPELACHGCPLTAPYRKAMQPMSALVADDFEEVRRATFDDDLERIRRRNDGEENMGVELGFPGARGPLMIRPGELMGFGSQPSIGKTASMVHMTQHIANQGVDAVVFSAETGINSFHDRLIANQAEVDSLALKRQRFYQGKLHLLQPDELERIDAGITALRNKSIWENYTTSNVERMLDALEGMLVRRQKPWFAPYVIQFDYFQFAQGTDLTAREEDHVRLAKRSYEFKALSKLAEQGVVVFAQLIRDSEGDDKPKINWWRGTGRFEHDIDRGIIMTGERMPGLYAPRTIHDVKDREGETGWKHDLLLEQTISRFKSKPNPQEQEKETRELDGGESEFGQWTLGGEGEGAR